LEKIKRRKIEHIIHSLKHINEKTSVFEDVHFVHNCLPECDLNLIDISTKLGPWKLKHPFIINSITGGSDKVKHINQSLATAAREFNLPIAVGSQKAGIEHPEVVHTYKIVREIYPEGIIFGNIGADASIDMVEKAISMINADGIQLHLNVPQEIIMPEGDKNFTGIVNNIEYLTSSIKIPIIVKETGFGISGEKAKTLSDIGVKIIDVGGSGGTNFIAIENERSDNDFGETFLEWGIPTAISLIETLNTVKKTSDVIASGGIKNGLEAAKALALGAKAVGLAGMPLSILLQKGLSELINYIHRIITELKFTMLMLGVKTLQDLRRCPLVITGFTLQWLNQRGYNTGNYAKREYR